MWMRIAAAVLFGVVAVEAGALEVAGTSFQPAFYDERIKEKYEPKAGGTFFVYLHNTGEAAASVRGGSLDGEDLDALRERGELNWWRVWPEEIPPGGWGAVWINAGVGCGALNAPGKLKFELDPAADGGCVATLPAETPPLRLAYVTLEKDMRGIQFYLRNEGEVPCGVEGVDVNGVSPPDLEILDKQLVPGQIGLVTATMGEPVEAGTLLVIQARARFGEEAVVAASALRATEPYFAIGEWNPGFWDEPEKVEAYLAHGMETLFVDPGTAKPAERYADRGIRLWVFPGDFQKSDFVEKNADNELIAIYKLMDEPEFRFSSQWGYETNQVFWRMGAPQPSCFNNAIAASMPEWAPISDIPMMDHYAVGAPTANRNPYRGAHLLEEVIWYMEALKRNSEPKPVWAWTQGLDKQWRRNPSQEELKVQLFLALGRGAKGILWFGPHAQDLPEKDLPAWEEMGRLNAMMKQVRPYLLFGEPAPLASIEGGEPNPGKVDAAAILSKAGIVVFVTNLDYTGHEAVQVVRPRPYDFTQQNGVQVKVLVPSWLDVSAVEEVDADTRHPLDWDAAGDAVTIELGSLRDGRVLLIR